MPDIFEQYLALPPGIPVLALAPLEGISTPAYRSLIEGLGAVDLLSTGFIRITAPNQSISPLLRHSQPLQIQIMAKQAETARDCISYWLSKGLLLKDDWLDLNCGCPSRRVVAHGAGAALLKTPSIIREILQKIRSVHTGPLSAKIRLGFHDKSEFLKIIEQLQDAPIDFVTIHPRTTRQGYTGKADWTVLQKAIDTLPYPVIGNGDVWGPEDAEALLQVAKVRGLMCGRGVLANPFLFCDIRNHLNGIPFNPEKRRQELQKWITTLADKIQKEESHKGTRAGLGRFKELSNWLSRNPLIEKKYFDKVKLCSSWEKIHHLISNNSFLK
jgi:tRNA-dihydrouridine synthase B